MKALEKAQLQHNQQAEAMLITLVLRNLLQYVAALHACPLFLFCF